MNYTHVYSAPCKAWHPLPGTMSLMHGHLHWAVIQPMTLSSSVYVETCKEKPLVHINIVFYSTTDPFEIWFSDADCTFASVFLHLCAG